MYSWDTRIRYSEVDSKGALTFTSLVDYFQDCSTFQSEDAGFGVNWLIKNRRAWVVNAWQIEIAALPHVGEAVTVSTNPYEIRRFLGLRNFCMETGDGARLATANSVWTFLNLETGIPERVPDEMTRAYCLGERFEMEYLSRKLPFPETGAISSGREMEVRPEHIDTNGHVNNARLVKIALDAAFVDRLPKISRLRAEYRKQVRLKDKLFPRINRQGDVVTVALEDSQGMPYCTVETTLTGGGV